jgi:heme oxygenase
MTSLMVSSTGLALVPDSQRPPLSVRLRKETRELHLAAEVAFDLDVRLSSRTLYADLLRILRGFYGAAEVVLVETPGWEELTPPLDIRPRLRAVLIDEDLAALAEPNDRPSGDLTAQPVATTFAAALGCLYVLEGSALGGRIITGRARVALGDDLPVSFFSSEHRSNLTADWRELRAALDAFGASEPDHVVAEVLDGAHKTFDSLRNALARSITP